MKYQDYQRNHVVLPGREKALEAFLNKEYEGMKHKRKNSVSSNSEDALTWSCFDLLSNLPLNKKLSVLNEIWEDAYQGKPEFPLNIDRLNKNDINIFIGEQYKGSTTKELTEVDASIEMPGVLIFFEAKLYSSISPKNPPKKPCDQIARKIRIGLDNPSRDGIFSSQKRDFYFIFLDIAPLDKLIMRKSKKEVEKPNKGGFHDKWKSAWLFSYYKHGRHNSRKPLREVLDGIQVESVEKVARNMGWLTWTDLFKDLLRGMVKDLS